MLQKVRDLVVLVKNDRKYMWMMLGVVGAIAFLFFAPTKEPRARKTARSAAPVSAPSSGGSEAYSDLVTAFKGQINEVQGKVEEVTKAVDDQKKNSKEYEERTAKIFEKMLERMNQLNASGETQNTNAEPVDVDITSADGQTIVSGAEQELDTVGFEPVPPPPPAATKNPKSAFIGVGDSVRVKLLAGVNAPTDGTPYPVLFKLIGDVTGPDGSKLPIGEARLVAASQGSLTDSRALFRLTDLSLRLPTGERKTFKVDGWIVGEDGIRGMSGILTDYFGQAIGGAIVAGGLQGAARGITASQTTTSRNRDGGYDTLVTGNTGVVALGGALDTAAGTSSRLIEKRLEQYVPMVSVYSGREATAVFARSLVLDDVLEAIDDEETVYAALD